MNPAIKKKEEISPAYSVVIKLGRERPQEALLYNNIIALLGSQHCYDKHHMSPSLIPRPHL